VQPCLTNADRGPERKAAEIVDEKATACILLPHPHSPHNACIHPAVNRVTNLQQGNANIECLLPCIRDFMTVLAILNHEHFIWQKNEHSVAPAVREYVKTSSLQRGQHWEVTEQHFDER